MQYRLNANISYCGEVMQQASSDSKLWKFRKYCILTRAELIN